MCGHDPENNCQVSEAPSHPEQAWVTILRKQCFSSSKGSLVVTHTCFPVAACFRTVTQAHWLPPLWGRKALLGLGGRTVNRPDCIWRGSRKEVSQPQRVSWADPGTLAPTGPLCLSVKVGLDHTQGLQIRQQNALFHVLNSF